MRVAVIGAGIVGVTTAYELAAQSHEVTVFERRGSVASEGSFANAGVLAAGDAWPWAAPRRPWPLLSPLFDRNTPLRLPMRSALSHLTWLAQWRRASRPATWAANAAALQRLAHFSRERLLELTRRLRLEYDQMPGFMVLLRSAAELRDIEPKLAVLRELGIAHELVDAPGCRQLEPGLHDGAPVFGGLHMPHDGVGNCRQFAQQLKNEAQRLGASFRFDADVVGLHAGAQPSLDLADGQSHAADAVVVCAGVQATRLLRGIGVRVPLLAVEGYSVTAPLRHAEGRAQTGPRGAVMDQRFQVAISRLGQRLRMAGGAEIGGPPAQMSEAPLQTLYRVLDDWFPGAALTREAQHWKGSRPMLPDGPPVTGESGAPGIWLNLGHGGSGWALACGSAHVIAERISGRAAPLDLSAMGVGRWR